MRNFRLAMAFAASPFLAAGAASFSPLFGDHAVLQRGKPVPVWGTAAPGEQGTLGFGAFTTPFRADDQGNWKVTLPAMNANPVPQRLSLSGGGAAVEDVVIGDVWLCSGQSNMAYSLGSDGRSADIAAAAYPGMRQFSVPLVNSAEPVPTVTGTWSVCSPATAAGFSAVAFYFGRSIWLDQNRGVPIGLLVSSVGGTQIDPWLAPEGVADQPALAPLYSKSILPFGPFSLFNGMIYPLAPLAFKGAIWYQGESGEGSNQGPDSYHLKMKALVRGWSRLFGMPDLPFYFVQIANYTQAPAGPTPEAPGGWADTRRQQTASLSIPHSGMAVAIDVGEADDIHPKDKLDVGERLASWALHNDYGRTSVVPGGPILRDAVADGNRIVCSFEYTGSGLISGSKTPYLPVRETPEQPLRRFSIAGADGVWREADAKIAGLTVVLSNAAIPVPRKAAYAYWMNPEGCNLYNRNGFPASPFLVEDVTQRFRITAQAGAGGSVTPAGDATFLAGATPAFAIVPATGQYIADLKVDGRSLGAVTQYAFDPLRGDHALSAEFTPLRPRYGIRADAGAGGTVSPSGVTPALQGSAATIRIAPDSGCRASLLMDGAPMGPRDAFTFSDISADHVLTIDFSCPILAEAGFGGVITPFGSVPAPAGKDRAFTFTPLPGYKLAGVRVDGKDIGSPASYVFPKVTGPHTLAVAFAGGAGASGSLPQAAKLIFSCMADRLPGNGAVTSWPATGFDRAFTPLGTPAVEILDGRRYMRAQYLRGDGMDAGTFTAPIACAGATIVVVARPVRSGATSNWNSIVNIFHDRLSLGLRNDTGKPCVLRNGVLSEGGVAIPDGQITILSLVVQEDGSYRVFANGSQVMVETAVKPMTSLQPGVAGAFATHITLGRNGADSWSAFNGDIGDVYLYGIPLSDGERQNLEALIEKRLIGGNTVGLATARRGGAPAAGKSMRDRRLDGRSIPSRRAKAGR